jgi:hypothetical protein
MSSANPPPPFDADAARRLLSYLQHEQTPELTPIEKQLESHLGDAVAEVERLRERVKELEASVERVAGDDMASLNAGLSLPNLQVTRDLRDARDLT